MVTFKWVGSCRRKPGSAGNIYGFWVSSGVLPAAGGQFIPAKGLRGLTRGEQRCASGAAFSPSPRDPSGDGGWSVDADNPGTFPVGDAGEVGRDRASDCSGGDGSIGGVNPPGGEGDGVSSRVQPRLPFGWSVRIFLPLSPLQL